jgi:hypothetical protein
VRAAQTGTELRILRAELLDAHRELVRLRSQIEQLLASNRDLSSLLSSSAQRTDELVKIIVAFRRLLESGDAAAAVRSIEEILVNVIGTEDFVLLLNTDGPRTPLHAIAGMGPARVRASKKPPTVDDLGHVESRVVPMYIAEHVVGVIVIAELLAHRDPYNASDDQVLALLSRFGASAVMAAHHRHEWTRLPVAALT